ncbi:ABC transporter permease [Candidatus Peregrinibacteria bacterium]|nr:ABC transporter permease [Candidatus Peregrinibacteria bacterium]
MKKILQISMAMAKAEFILKNEGNYLGVLWYVLEPLFLLSIFLLVKKITGADIEHYPLYLVIGLTMFNFFRKVTDSTITAIINNHYLLSNLIIPKEVFVLSTFLRVVYSHIFEIVIMLSFLLFFHMPIWYLLFYIPIFIVFSIFILGVSFFLSSISVYINDLGNLWGVFSRVLWLATPIFYSSKLELPLNINLINPLYHFITISRDIIIYHQAPDLKMVTIVSIESIIIFLLGFFIFQKVKPAFAENL